MNGCLGHHASGFSVFQERIGGYSLLYPIGNVVFGDGDGFLTAIRAGQVLWQYSGGESFTSAPCLDPYGRQGRRHSVAICLPLLASAASSCLLCLLCLFYRWIWAHW